jgi:glycosyltransferase involved in cell wall biosynthesis
LIVESFARMPDKKLVVIGDGPDLAKVKAAAKSNVQVLGFQPDDAMVSYMQRAKALIFAAEEDFGLVPIEAQACGTPVIAYGKGGVLETVHGLDHEQPTGLFFNEQSVESICNAVSAFEKNQDKFLVENCVKNAAQFTPDQFREKIKQYVKAHAGYVQ